MNRYLAFIRGVRLKGLEPSRLAAPDPKSGASTNFATSANVVQRYEFSHLSPKYSEEKILKAMRGDGRMVGLGGMEENKKSASPKKNCAYSLLNCRAWRSRQVGAWLWRSRCREGMRPLVGAQYFAPASTDGKRIVNTTGRGGIEGRAQNIAPLHLMRCLIVECGGL